MREIFKSPQRVPLRIWAERLDADVLAQLRKLARSRVLAGPIAVLPDVHNAGEVCVGTVLATKDVLFPSAIGEDLGCGMCAQSLPLAAQDFQREDWERICAELVAAIPTGRHTHNRPCELPEELRKYAMSCRALEHDRDWLGPRHLGTLGGGNHFVELQAAPDGQLWVSIHSGSRGPGAAIAAHHAKVTQSGAGRKDASGLWFLDWASPEGQSFRQDLEWALQFAVANRRRMMGLVTETLKRYTGRPVEPTPGFDVPHNSITREVHNGKELVVHRKGASSAPAGTRGILPGSMGTTTYVVEGLGNPLAYGFSAHGAGRHLTRTEARRRISPEQLRREIAHVVCLGSQRLDEALVEEAPSAYKDVREVLREQEDLVRPVLRLWPLAAVKGD